MLSSQSAKQAKRKVLSRNIAKPHKMDEHDMHTPKVIEMNTGESIKNISTP